MNGINAVLSGMFWRTAPICTSVDKSVLVLLRLTLKNDTIIKWNVLAKVNSTKSPKNRNRKYYCLTGRKSKVILYI